MFLIRVIAWNRYIPYGKRHKRPPIMPRNHQKIKSRFLSQLQSLTHIAIDKRYVHKFEKNIYI